MTRNCSESKAEEHHSEGKTLSDVAEGTDATLSTQQLEEDPVGVDEKTNKRLLWRIDFFIMPIMCLIYALNFLDKTTLSLASVMGLRSPPSEDLLQSGISLSGTQYSWMSSVFYFGYLVWEWPTSRLLQRLPLAKYSAFNILAWGTVLTCHASLRNYAGGIVVRFLLGVFEAAVTPGFALITAKWYKREEQALRTAIWFSFNGVASIVGGCSAYGILNGATKYGTLLEPWRVLFLATGLLTVLAGFIFLAVLPDDENNAWWLSESDRALAVLRTRDNWQSADKREWKRYQFREALADPMTWAFCLCAFLSTIPNGGITNFFSQLIVGFGYTAQESLLYGAPAGAVGIIALLINGYLGGMYGNRILWGTAGLLLSIVGMVLIIALHENNSRARLAGYYLTSSCPTGFVALLSLVSSNVGGHTKKVTVAAFFLIAYCAGNIIGPQTFRARDAPRYVPGQIVTLVCWGLAVIDLLFIRWYYRLQNVKKAAIRASPAYQRPRNQFLDTTDKENPEFVYVL